jgi:hypothetical protein
MGFPGPFAPVTDAVLARARQDPVFRQQLLAQSLDHLLAGLKRLRTMPDSVRDNAGQVREGAALAVRLAELIQAAGGSQPVL